MMGFLDFFKKPKKKVDSNNANQQKSVEKNPVNNSISCTPYIADYDIVPIPNFPEFKDVYKRQSLHRGGNPSRLERGFLFRTGSIFSVSQLPFIPSYL